MCVYARVRACTCVCISIYLRQLRAVNRQVIINPTIERRRVNRPRKRNRGGERFTISNDSQRILVFLLVPCDVLREIFVRSLYVGSFSSSMTRAETSSIEKTYITGARISGTRRVSSGNTEALLVLWSRAKSKSTNERKQRRRGVCAVENSCSLSRTVYSRGEHVARGAESFFRPTTTFNERGERWNGSKHLTDIGYKLDKNNVRSNRQNNRVLFAIVKRIVDLLAAPTMCCICNPCNNITDIHRVPSRGMKLVLRS